MTELEKLKAENETYRKASERGIAFKVTHEGAVSVYGLGAYPVTMYAEQWANVLRHGSELSKFIDENHDDLKNS